MTDNKINVYKDALILQLENIIKASDEKTTNLEEELRSKKYELKVIRDSYESKIGIEIQKELNKLIERMKESEEERDKYKRGYYILYDYFESIPEEEKKWVDAKLRNLDL